MSTLQVQVSAARLLTPVVRELTLRAVSGPLPPFSSGSHIQLVMQGASREMRNAYSLASDPADAHAWRIAVRKADVSRGGSAYVHADIEPGMTLRVTRPANLFALHATAQRHVLIAGGIGITPFIAHVAELERRHADFELHYALRGGLSDAYAKELRARLGQRFHAYDSNAAAAQRLDVKRVLATQPLGAHVYVCGPQSLIDAVHAGARALGWHARRVHAEAFAAPAPGTPFTAVLARSGQRVEVAADRSLLEALEASGVAVPNLCRGGVCGQCATRHLQGDVEHRDHFLDAGERATHLMPCVSRACGDTLHLDL
ncbi:PDR/VanB family oxidoreductase [Paraburkholderia bannensis]|uniref:PDR/VanB family oxidoreductase n=1 Tax=Paraburkholderia bannensis TaxID=765414 RepID=UPI002AB6408C|nr:PDR/VanB family oxidoreductase [Paraburkholderia bannensis]